jgi:hypothetical protein
MDPVKTIAAIIPTSIDPPKFPGAISSDHIAGKSKAKEIPNTIAALFNVRNGRGKNIEVNNHNDHKVPIYITTPITSAKPSLVITSRKLMGCCCKAGGRRTDTWLAFKIG